ncbi:hypothetical protein Caci_4786 [Catenulispora acidiphila DSM 44928]|uniref:Uncharacterized protein n=1 Tax=Catenulispora acidiphila (strain DSM 44928 / JCM 14897 / NBRC 102108 / NRRL B-24433 / ID139908) TaxID=479433 RepID=C7Q1B8_CATAD|nr:hypothetical protein Caci_4786 [Catenulispora acidiphila DSM 44928]
MVIAGPAGEDAAPLETFKDSLVSAANAIAEELARAGRQGRLAEVEKGILERYVKRSKLARQRFIKAGGSASVMLALEEFHQADVEFEQVLAPEVAALLAAYVEANGQKWLSESDATIIGGSLETTGAALLAAGLPLFAENAFRQAGTLYRRFNDSSGEDRCKYLAAAAHRVSLPRWSGKRLLADLQAVLFGYGYRPLRLLVWILVLVAGFTVWLLALPRTGGANESEAFYVAVQNFVNPMGLGDVRLLSGPWKPVLEIETYTGDVFRNLFFVLLIRRLFRL